MKNNLPRIYLDMDGVLVDFEKQLVDTVKMPISQWMKLDRKKRWDPVIARKDFWSTAPWNNEGKKLLQFVKKYNPHILSAYVEESYDPNCIPGKTAWLRKNARITDKSKINLVRRKEKKNFATKGGQKNILIDDYIKNVREFTSAGGIGIPKGLHIALVGGLFCANFLVFTFFGSIFIS